MWALRHTIMPMGQVRRTLSWQFLGRSPTLAGSGVTLIAPAGLEH